MLPDCSIVDLSSPSYVWVYYKGADGVDSTLFFPISIKYDDWKLCQGRGHGLTIADQQGLANHSVPHDDSHGLKT